MEQDIPALLTRRHWTPQRLHRAARSGQVVCLLPGVYARADRATDPLIRAEAVRLWNPNAVVCGAAAARATFWPELAVPLVDVAAPTNLGRAGYRFSRRAIPSDLCVYVGDLRVAAPSATALDLAAETDGASIDQVLRSRHARIGDLEAAFAQLPHRRGNRTTAKLLLDSRAEPWSAPERMAHTLLRGAGVTGWRANAEVIARGHRYYVDILFRAERLCVEIDGREFHTAPQVFESDRLRQNDLVLRGWHVLRFTPHRLLTDPDGILADIALGRRLGRRR